MELRSNLKPFLSAYEAEIVKKIESLGGKFDLNSDLTLEDQLLACEAIAESTPVINYREKDELSDSVFRGSESVSGACYFGVNSELLNKYSDAIQKLNGLRSSQLSPIEIANIIEEPLGKPRKDGHWLWLSIHWNLRQVLWVLKDIFKGVSTGYILPSKAADYFTYRLKFRARKKLPKLSKTAKGGSS